MRKLTKALAAVLLLAIVLSCFAVFSAFAEGTEAQSVSAEDNYGDVVFDMNATPDKIMNNVGENGYADVPVFTVDKGGELPIWDINYVNTPAGANPNTANLIKIFADKNDIRYQDSAVNGAKNVDYIVIDLDLATDTEFIDEITLNLRYNKSDDDTTAGTTSTRAATLPIIMKDTDGRVCVANSGGSNTVRPAFDSKDKWTNVTIVYDITSGASATSYENDIGVGYVYIDGYYCGNINGVLAAGAEIDFLRVSFDPATLTADNASTKIANFTFKTFEVGYSGRMTESGVLASDLVSLHNIPELRYAVADRPDTPEGYTGYEIATITRVVDGKTEDIPVYDVDDLNGDLLDGDIVTAHSDLAALKSFYVVKMVSKTTVNEETGEEVTADAPADITWQDEKGVELGAEGSLYEAPKVIDVPSTADWAVITNGTYANSGSAESSYDAYTKISIDPLCKAIPTKSGKTSEIILFSDYTVYGYGASGSSVTSSTAYRKSSSMTFDLNGYTLKNDCQYGSSAHFLGGAAAVTFTFKNGTIVQRNGGQNLVYMYTAGTRVILENCKVQNLGSSSTMFDHRYGTLIYRDCTIAAGYAEADAQKATGDYHSYFVMDGCTVTAKAPLVNVAQTNGSKVGRYGSGNMWTAFLNTTVTTTEVLVQGDAYAHGHTSTAAAYMKNVVNHHVAILGSDITSSGNNILQYTLLNSDTPTNIDYIDEITSYETTDENGETITISETMPVTLNYEAYIHGSRIETQSSTDGALLYMTPKYDKTKVVMSGDVRLVNSDFNLSNGILELPLAADINVKVSDGCRFSSDTTMSSEGKIEPIMTYGDGNSALVHTSNGDGIYNYIVSSDYRTCSYTLGAQQPETFYWNAQSDEADAINMDKVVTLENKEGAYRYEWTNDGNDYTAVLKRAFAFSAKTTMTLEDNFNYNLYIPAELYAQLSALECVTIKVNGEALSTAELVTKGEDEQYYVTRVGVAPTASDAETIALDVIVKGAYGDEVTVIDAEFSVLDYINDILVKNADKQADVDLMYAILNYISAACEYTNTNAALKTVVDDKLEAAGIAAPGEIQGEGKYAAPAGTTGASVYFGATNGWSIRLADGVESITVTYGNVTKEYTAGEDGVVNVEVPMQYFVEGIDVNGTVINLKGYYDKLTDANAQAMAKAIANYSYAAAAYVASVSGN